MVTAIIFDLFGVLVNESISIFIDKHCENNSVLYREMWDVIRAGNAGMLSIEEVNKKVAELAKVSVSELLEYRRKTELPNELLFEYIEEIRSKGIKTAILSNVTRGGISRHFSKEITDEYFDFVVESGSLGIAKPDSEIYKYVCKLLAEEPSNVVMIDDREDFCAGAEQAGLGYSILYKDFHQTKQEIASLIV